VQRRFLSRRRCRPTTRAIRRDPEISRGLRIGLHDLLLLIVLLALVPFLLDRPCCPS